jgi:hypothetical protein
VSAPKSDKDDRHVLALQIAILMLCWRSVMNESGLLMRIMKVFEGLMKGFVAFGLSFIIVAACLLGIFILIAISILGDILKKGIIF